LLCDRLDSIRIFSQAWSQVLNGPSQSAQPPVAFLENFRPKRIDLSIMNMYLF